MADSAYQTSLTFTTIHGTSVTVPPQAVARLSSARLSPHAWQRFVTGIAAAGHDGVPEEIVTPVASSTNTFRMLKALRDMLAAYAPQLRIVNHGRRIYVAESDRFLHPEFSLGGRTIQFEAPTAVKLPEQVLLALHAFANAPGHSLSQTELSALLHVRVHRDSDNAMVNKLVARVTTALQQNNPPLHIKGDMMRFTLVEGALPQRPSHKAAHKPGSPNDAPLPPEPIASVRDSGIAFQPVAGTLVIDGQDYFLDIEEDSYLRANAAIVLSTVMTQGTFSVALYGARLKNTPNSPLSMPRVVEAIHDALRQASAPVRFTDDMLPGKYTLKRTQPVAKPR